MGYRIEANPFEEAVSQSVQARERQARETAERTARRVALWDAAHEEGMTTIPSAPDKSARSACSAACVGEVVWTTTKRARCRPVISRMTFISAWWSRRGLASSP